MSNKFIKYLFFILPVLIVIYFLFSIIPLFNGFPTGIDAPHHIMWAKSFINNTYPPELMWRNENPSPYPAPEVFFALAHLYTELSFEYLFPLIIIILIISTLSIASLIAKKLFGHWEAVLTFILGSSMYFFIIDSISVGTMSEIFGTSILFLTLYLFIVKKYYLIPFFLVVGYFSHPFFSIYTILIILVSAPFLLTNNKFQILIKKYKYKLSITSIAIFSFILINTLIFWNQIKEVKVFNMLTSDNQIISAGKYYTLEGILSRSNHLYILYALSLLGLLLFLKKSQHFNKYFFAIISVVFILMPFNYKFNINIEPFRFISFLEIFVAIFSSYSVIFFYKKVSNNYKNIVLSLILILSLLFSYNNMILAQERIIEFTKDSLTKLPEEDLRVMEWMKDNIETKNNNYVCSLYKWGHWIPAISEKKVIYGGYENPKDNKSSCAGIFNSENKDKITKIAKEYNLKYVYFSSHQDMNLAIEKNFKLLKKEENASLYKLY